MDIDELFADELEALLTKYQNQIDPRTLATIMGETILDLYMSVPQDLNRKQLEAMAREAVAKRSQAQHTQAKRLPDVERN